MKALYPVERLLAITELALERLTVDIKESAGTNDQYEFIEAKSIIENIRAFARAVSIDKSGLVSLEQHEMYVLFTVLAKV